MVIGNPLRHHSLQNLQNNINNDAPFAVCHVDGRGEQLMIPGNRTCPYGWTKEYESLLVYVQTKATIVCLDSEPDILSGESASVHGGLCYTAEVVCGALSCPPDVDGHEVASVFCTK